MPDGLKEAERGEAMTIATEKMAEAVSGVEQAIEDVNEASQ